MLSIWSSLKFCRLLKIKYVYSNLDYFVFIVHCTALLKGKNNVFALCPIHNRITTKKKLNGCKFRAFADGILMGECNTILVAYYSST